METQIEPYPYLVTYPYKYFPFSFTSPEFRQVVCVIDPCDLFPNGLKEIHTKFYGDDDYLEMGHFHRFNGDPERAMEMIRAFIKN